MSNSRFPKLTSAVLEAIDSPHPHLTAQGVTAHVRKSLPLARHQQVTAELQRLIDAGRAQALHESHLPARYRLTPRKPTPRPDEEQITLPL